MKMKGRLVNEKTLELNITHEGMSGVRIGVIGFSQHQESKIGADVLYPCGKPFVIQFKAAKRGVDGHSATFQVNNNRKRNQHRVLDVIAKSGVCEAYYAFPLIVSDVFLTANFGNLLKFTFMVEAQRITGNINWMNQVHTVEMKSGFAFTVKSGETVSGEGFSAKEFFDKKAKEIEGKIVDETIMSGYIRDLIERMDHIAKEAEIPGESEHTITVIGTDITKEQLGYLQLPVRIRGLQQG